MYARYIAGPGLWQINRYNGVAACFAFFVGIGYRPRHPTTTITSAPHRVCSLVVTCATLRLLWPHAQQLMRSPAALPVGRTPPSRPRPRHRHRPALGTLPSAVAPLSARLIRTMSGKLPLRFLFFLLLADGHVRPSVAARLPHTGRRARQPLLESGLQASTRPPVQRPEAAHLVRALQAPSPGNRDALHQAMLACIVRPSDRGCPPLAAGTSAPCSSSMRSSRAACCPPHRPRLSRFAPTWPPRWPATTRSFSQRTACCTARHGCTSACMRSTT